MYNKYEKRKNSVVRRFLLIFPAMLIIMAFTACGGKKAVHSVEGMVRTAKDETNPEETPAAEEKKMLTGRLNRAIGQLNGLKKMVEEDAYCADILIQASACTAAVNSFSKVLISSHLKSCVQNDIKNGNEESLDEFLKIMSKLLN